MEQLDYFGHLERKRQSGSDRGIPAWKL